MSVQQDTQPSIARSNTVILGRAGIDGASHPAIISPLLPVKPMFAQ